MASAIFWAYRCFAPDTSVAFMTFAQLRLLVADTIIRAFSLTVANFFCAASAGEPVFAFTDCVPVYANTFSIVIT